MDQFKYEELDSHISANDYGYHNHHNKNTKRYYKNEVDDRV